MHIYCIKNIIIFIYADLPTGECIITRCSVPAVGID